MISFNHNAEIIYESLSFNQNEYVENILKFLLKVAAESNEETFPPSVKSFSDMFDLDSESDDMELLISALAFMFTELKTSSVFLLKLMIMNDLDVEKNYAKKNISHLLEYISYNLLKNDYLKVAVFYTLSDNLIMLTKKLKDYMIFNLITNISEKLISDLEKKNILKSCENTNTDNNKNENTPDDISGVDWDNLLNQLTKNKNNKNNNKGGK